MIEIVTHVTHPLCYTVSWKSAGGRKVSPLFWIVLHPGIGTASRRVGVRAGGFLYFGLPHGRRKAGDCGMAKGYDNLIPLNRRSKDVQRAIQEKGRQANREKWKQKIDLRNSVQNFLNGDYTVDGETMTGEEWFIKKVLEALSNTKNQNWKAAAEIIVSLSESGKAGAEVERINAETEYTKAKTKLIQTETDDGGTGDDGLIEALNAAAIERGKREPDES